MLATMDVLINRRGQPPRPVGGAGGQRERFDNDGPLGGGFHPGWRRPLRPLRAPQPPPRPVVRSEEHTSELHSLTNLVCRLLLEKKKKKKQTITTLKKTKHPKKTS